MLIKMPKNIILITADALRPDVAVHLPFLGKLVSKSSFFSNVFSYQNNSTGAFYSIFSGIYGNKSEANSYFGSLNFKKDRCKLLTQYFKEQGYFTLAHSMSDIILPREHFDAYYCELDEEKIPALYDRMLYELKHCGKNFFVHFHVALIHTRIIENVAKKFKYKDKEYYEQVEKNKENYFQYALEADARIQHLLEQFDLRSCILVIYSDHGTTYGEKFGERFYGSLCYDDTLRTFALFYGADFPAFCSDLVVRGVDIMPTLLDVMNIEEDGKTIMDGKSLVPLIKGKKEERVAFSEVAPLQGSSDYPSPKKPNIHAVRTNYWKLLFYRSTNTYELYDLKNDSHEDKNLINRGLAVEGEMKRLLHKHLD